MGDVVEKIEDYLLCSHGKENLDDCFLWGRVGSSDWRIAVNTTEIARPVNVEGTKYLVPAGAMVVFWQDNIVGAFVPMGTQDPKEFAMAGAMTGDNEQALVDELAESMGGA
jgi:hypothetical protein